MRIGIGARARVLAACLMFCARVLGAAETPTGGALIDAVQNDDRAAVAALLNKRVDVNAREDDGATALAWAAVRCNSEIAALLLKSGANPNLVNEQGSARCTWRSRTAHQRWSASACQGRRSEHRAGRWRNATDGGDAAGPG